MLTIRSGIRSAAAAAAIALVSLLAGCGRTTEVASPPPSPAAASPAPSPEVLAALAKADALDGAADKTIKKCYACSLGMDGKAEFASAVGEYRAYFCKEGCKKAFDKDPAAMVLATAAGKK